MSSRARHGFYAFILSICLLTLAAAPARADLDTLRSADNEIWASFGGDFFNYKEPSGAPDLPDSEHGWLPSIGFGASLLGPQTGQGMTSNLYLALEGSASFGDAHYNGAYFYYPTTPLQGTTSESIFDFDGKLGRAFPLGNVAMLIPYGELGYRYWDRDLGNDQVEDYHNFDALAGLMVQISPIRGVELSAYGSAGTTFAPSMTTGGDTYNLGPAGMYKIGGKLGFALAQQLELFTTLDYDHLRYVQSGVVDAAYEPSSFTNNTTLRVGLGYEFR